MLRVLSLILLLLLTSCVAQEQLEGCYDTDGYQVYLAPITTEILQRRNVGVAMATWHPTTPMIWFDETFFPQLQPLTREFTKWHECGHHALGHIKDLKRTLEQYGIFFMEHSADCYALKHLNLLGYSTDTVQTALEADTDLMTEATISKKPPYTHEFSNIFFRQRQQALRTCR